MGKRGGKKLTNNLSRSQNSVSTKSMLRHEHLKNLAMLFNTGDTPVPSTAAFFGRCLSADAETSGIAPNPELVSCQRCETILQPGVNCTVRIEKSPAQKHGRRKKSNGSMTQNNVIYTCHFCSHRNLKRGTAKGHMKEISPPKPKTPPIQKPIDNIPRDTSVLKEQDDVTSSPPNTKKIEVENSEANTPRPMLTLDRGTRKRKPKNGKSIDLGSVSITAGTEKTVGGSTKRKRKTWTSLKEIAEQDKSLKKIPFVL